MPPRYSLVFGPVIYSFPGLYLFMCHHAFAFVHYTDVCNIKTSFISEFTHTKYKLVTRVTNCDQHMFANRGLFVALRALDTSGQSSCCTCSVQCTAQPALGNLEAECACAIYRPTVQG